LDALEKREVRVGRRVAVEVVEEEMDLDPDPPPWDERDLFRVWMLEEEEEEEAMDAPRP